MNFCTSNTHDDTRVLLHALILRVKVLEDLLHHQKSSHSQIGSSQIGSSQIGSSQIGSSQTVTPSSSSVVSPQVAPSPQQFNSLLVNDEKFSELKDIVMRLVENDAENAKESEKWTRMLVEHSNGIRDIKEKLKMYYDV